MPEVFAQKEKEKEKENLWNRYPSTLSTFKVGNQPPSLSICSRGTPWWSLTSGRFHLSDQQAYLISFDSFRSEVAKVPSR